MPQITLKKTWLTAATPIDYFTDTTVQMRTASTMLAYKNLLVGAGWVVEQSSNGTPGGTGSGDHWATRADLLYGLAGVAHAWAVLSNVGFLAGFQILLDYGPATNNTNKGNANFGACPSGYNTDGTYQVRPTAAGVEALLADKVFFDPQQYSYGTTLLYSADAQCFRLFTTMNGYCGDNFGSYSAYGGAVIMIERPLNPDDAWTNPFVLCVYQAQSGSLGGWSYQTVSDSNLYARAIVKGVSCVMVLSTNMGRGNLSARWFCRTVRHAGAATNGSVDFYPMFFLGESGQAVGILGRAADLFAAPLHHINCMRYPTVGNARGLIKLGSMATGCPDAIVEVF